MPKYKVTYYGEMICNKSEEHFAKDEDHAISLTKAFKYPITIVEVIEIKENEAGMYYIELDYERKSQNKKGSDSFNIELQKGWTIESVRLMLANDYFCCQLTFKTIKKVYL